MFVKLNLAAFILLLVSAGTKCRRSILDAELKPNADPEPVSERWRRSVIEKISEQRKQTVLEEALANFRNSVSQLNALLSSAKNGSGTSRQTAMDNSQSQSQSKGVVQHEFSDQWDLDLSRARATSLDSPFTDAANFNSIRKALLSNSEVRKDDAESEPLIDDDQFEYADIVGAELSQGDQGKPKPDKGNQGKTNAGKEAALPFDPVDEAEMELGFKPESLQDGNDKTAVKSEPKQTKTGLDSKKTVKTGRKHHSRKHPDAKDTKGLPFDPVDEAEMELGILPDSLATKSQKNQKSGGRKTKSDSDKSSSDTTQRDKSPPLPFDPVDEAEMELGIDPFPSAKSGVEKTSGNDKDKAEAKSRRRPHSEAECSDDQIRICGDREPCVCNFATATSIDCTHSLQGELGSSREKSGSKQGASANICPTVNMKSNYILQKVNLRHNGITKLEHEKIVPGYETEIEVLDLSKNELTEIPERVFEHFNNLQVLSLAGNRIAKLTKQSFHNLSSLVELDLRYNNLSELRGNIFGFLKNLKILLLDGNPLTHIDTEVFHGLSNLNLLSLDQTNLENVHEDWFEGVRTLRTFTMQDAQLNVVPPGLHRISTIEYLYLSGNPITAIMENDFSGLRNLRVLYLDQMPELSFVDDCAFCGLPRLSRLLMHNCPKLSQLHPNAFGGNTTRVQRMELLDLSNNKLKSLHVELLPWSEIATLSLENNSWACDCSMQWFAGKSFQTIDVPRCGEQSKFAGTPLSSLSALDMCFSGRRIPLRLRLIVAAITISFVCVLFFIIYCLYRGTCRVKRFRTLYKRNYTNVQYAYRNLSVKSDADTDAVDGKEDVVALFSTRKKDNSNGEELMASL